MWVPLQEVYQRLRFGERDRDAFGDPETALEIRIRDAKDRRFPFFGNVFQNAFACGFRARFGKGEFCVKRRLQGFESPPFETIPESLSRRTGGFRLRRKVQDDQYPMAAMPRRGIVCRFHAGNRGRDSVSTSPEYALARDAQLLSMAAAIGKVPPSISTSR